MSEVAPSTSTELRVAIVGGGKMARNHAGAVPRTGVPAHVVAFAEPDSDSRRAFLDVAPGAAPFDSLADLLSSVQVDVVHICTPPSTHESLAQTALEAGCHVYVEKPFAETREGAERILNEAAKRGLCVCAGHQLLFEAPMRKAIELLPAVGAVHHVESYFAFRPTRNQARPLRDDEQLLDVLPHPVYSLLRVLELCAPAEEMRAQSCELGPGGTLHALLQRGPLTASLVVTLEGRPVESYLRIVGRSGTIHADFVRGSVQHAIGPGTSFIDKTLNPFRQARQLTVGTTTALAGRVRNRQASYPGLAEIFEALYRAIRGQGESPVTADNILDTAAVCDRVRALLREVPAELGEPIAPRVAVTGGTGFLGQELVVALQAAGHGVRVLSRREPAPWSRIPAVEYVTADLGGALPENALAGIETVIHLAAETSGGFEEHRRNSVDAAERLMRAAATAGVQHVIHVSSLAVLASEGNAPIREDTPLDPAGKERGPYVWGKLESERLVSELAPQLGVALTIVRPGPIVDFRELEPPGRLGRRVGNFLFAVGSPRETLAVVDRVFAAKALAWLVDHAKEAPAKLNLLSPTLPTRADFVRKLRVNDPGLRVIWLPRPLLRVLSALGVRAQRILRPEQTPVDLERAFGNEVFDTTAVAALDAQIEAGPG